MDAFRAWLSQLQFDGVWQTAVLVAASLLCITFHETCHGWVAYKLGDPTAKRMGRLTLNPLKHVDLSGLIMMALFRFGWAKPVPVDMRNFKDPKKGMALTALAGPVSNVLLAYVAAVLCNGMIFLNDRFGSGWLLMGLIQFLIYVQIISAGLAVFNVFPIPPLDGSKVLFALLSDRAYETLMRYEKYGMGLLMLLLVTGAIDTPLEAMRSWLLMWLNNLAVWGYTLPNAIF